MEPTLNNIRTIDLEMRSLGYGREKIGPALGVGRATWWRWHNGFQKPSRHAWNAVVSAYNGLMRGRCRVA